MKNASATEIGQPAFRLKAAAGSVLVLRLSIQSRMIAAAVVRPSLRAWVRDDGAVEETEHRVSPSYCYLRQGASAGLTLTTTLPQTWQPGERWHSALSFPGIEDEILPIELEILLPSEPEAPLAEHHISLTLPLTGYPDEPDAAGTSTQAIYTLLAGLAGLDVIPARWVIAEILTAICESGDAYAQTEDGAAFLNRLTRTRFYKNGVLAFRGAQVPNWILVGLTISSGLQAALGGKHQAGSILYTWESWLLSLIEMDIENASGPMGEIKLPPPSLEESMAAFGTDAEHWFATLVLGLVQLSPRIRATLETLCEQVAAPEAPPEDTAPKDPVDVLAEEGSPLR